MPPNNGSPDCNCGPLKPRAKEKPIDEELSADQILSKVKLIVDETTGVLFFRYNANLYMRTVTTEEDP